MREQVRPSVTRAEEVAANASGENFPVALRLLPARHRRHLGHLYFFARLTDDLGDEAREAREAREAPEARAAPEATTDVTELRLRLLDEGAPLVGTLRGAARLAVAGYLAGGRAALAAIRAQDYDVLKGTPRPHKPRLAAELVQAYVRGR